MGRAEVMSLHAPAPRPPSDPNGSGAPGAVLRLLRDVEAGHRLTIPEAASLYRDAPLAELAATANRLRERKTDPGTVTFVVDRNINYTNVCNVYCTFCAFYRTPKDPDTYLLTTDEVVRKVEELVHIGGTQVLLQGGLNPAIGLPYVEAMFRAIRDRFPAVDIHSLTATEVEFYAKQEGLTLEETVARLKAAGLKSLPGGGMEILADSVRERVSPLKTSASAYIDVHRIVHRAGMTSTATMMFGMNEEIEDRFHHLSMVRALQDETHNFTAFIPWTFQTDGSTPMKFVRPGEEPHGLRVRKATADEYLRMIAMSRLFLDNFDHIQSGWVTEGHRIAQAALGMGADDWGGVLMEENVISAAGTLFVMSPGNARRAIRECGYVPAQRTTYYKIVRRFEEEPPEEALPRDLTLAPGQKRVLPPGGTSSARFPVRVARSEP
ncbi:MAG: cyclic dehypoxanthinyl futalosine synthase [Thermoplasmatota archaeon]